MLGGSKTFLFPGLLLLLLLPIHCTGNEDRETVASRLRRDGDVLYNRVDRDGSLGVVAGSFSAQYALRVSGTNNKCNVRVRATLAGLGFLDDAERRRRRNGGGSGGGGDGANDTDPFSDFALYVSLDVEGQAPDLSQNVLAFPSGDETGRNSQRSILVPTGAYDAPARAAVLSLASPEVTLVPLWSEASLEPGTRPVHPEAGNGSDVDPLLSLWRNVSFRTVTYQGPAAGGEPSPGRYVLTLFTLSPGPVDYSVEVLIEDGLGAYVGGGAIVTALLLTAGIVLYVRKKTKRIRTKKEEILGTEMTGVVATSERPKSMVDLLSDTRLALRRHYRAKK